MQERCDVAVAGAGAAGLAAAIAAAQAAAERGRSLRIVVLDGARSIGAKILISGGGRCNVTHDTVEASDFNGTQHVVRHVLAQFGQAQTVRWFESLGVQLKRESTGKLFPVTNAARTVLEALLNRCRALGVEVRAAHRVNGLQVCDAEAGEHGSSGPAFRILHEHGVLQARRLVMATGGRSLPRTGSDGAAQALLTGLGHGVTPCLPALVPLVLAPGIFHARISGVSCTVELTVLADGRLADRRRGSLLWTHFGISGPVVLDASRHVTVARAAGKQVGLRCSLLPGTGRSELDGLLERQAASQPRLPLRSAVGAGLPARLVDEVISHGGLEPAALLGSLTRTARGRLAATFTELELPVVRARGWDFAEVTAGGIPLNEVDFRTLESRRTPGLYLAGELLDCDGRIGGFNFQWAWSTGHIAGRAAAVSLAG